MGRKTIWDGHNLPEQGDIVLCHLADIDAWVPHKVAGFDVTPWENNHRIAVNVVASDDNRSRKNQRLLKDCFPPDTDPLDLPRKGCLKTARQLANEKHIGAVSGRATCAAS